MTKTLASSDRTYDQNTVYLDKLTATKNYRIFRVSMARTNVQLSTGARLADFLTVGFLAMHAASATISKKPDCARMLD